MERLGYQPLVRPLGVMPDAVTCTKINDVLLLALVETKGKEEEILKLAIETIPQT